MTIEEQEESLGEVSLTVRMFCDILRQHPKAALLAVTGQLGSAQQRDIMPDEQMRNRFNLMWGTYQRSVKYWNSAEKQLLHEVTRELTLDSLQEKVNVFILKP